MPALPNSANGAATPSAMVEGPPCVHAVPAPGVGVTTGVGTRPGGVGVAPGSVGTGWMAGTLQSPQLHAARNVITASTESNRIEREMLRIFIVLRTLCRRRGRGHHASDRSVRSFSRRTGHRRNRHRDTAGNGGARG